ncbi:hypothetical protein, partial [Escherichia coli]|uniref:hypothetical protein n=1 Tax=Escherichia coli TaxID=562 RepID=UPI001A7E0D74
FKVSSHTQELHKVVLLRRQSGIKDSHSARCFNKSKGVLITGLKLKAFRTPQPIWGFSGPKKARLNRRAVITLCYLANQNL